MTISKLICEPYEISSRFYRALEEKASSLESDAQKDEIFAQSLDNPDHLQRQSLLIKTQRDKAQRFRDFLAGARIRRDEPPSTR